MQFSMKILLKKITNSFLKDRNRYMDGYREEFGRGRISAEEDDCKLKLKLLWELGVKKKLYTFFRHSETKFLISSVFMFSRKKEKNVFSAGLSKILFQHFGGGRIALIPTPCCNRYNTMQRQSVVSKVNVTYRRCFHFKQITGKQIEQNSKICIFCGFYKFYDGDSRRKL